MEWVLALLSLVIGLGGGYFIAHNGDREKKRADSLKNELDCVNAELHEYRGRVNQHFSRTAELVEALAVNSREIYNHLAEGSQKLCDVDVVKIQQKGATSLPKQASEATSASAARRIKSSESTTETLEEGWYEILPEMEERQKEEPMH